MERCSIATPAGTFSALRWDRAGPHAPWLHFGHATGMHAQLYARLLEPLADDFRILAIDARGHGHSRALGDPAAMTGWSLMAGDLLAVIDAVEPNAPWLLAGHSLGAVVSMLAADKRPERVAAMVLADPPVVSFAAAAEARAGRPMENHMAQQAARRRPAFASRAEARAAYAGRGVFARWSDADLDAYLDGGLVAGADGVELACTPAMEGATFAAWPQDLDQVIGRLSTPFALLAAEHHSTVQPAEFDVLKAHPRCAGAGRVAGSDHFLPLSHPQAVQDAIRSLATATGLAPGSQAAAPPAVPR